jgi:alkaline phosphatase
MPYTTVGYANGLGFRDLGDETDADVSYNEAALAGRVDLTGVDTTTPGYHQEATVPLGSETHAGEDISLHAKGPGAQLAQGVVEQNVIFHIINQALELIEE